jgi:glucose-6-phosphate dehydrogenase assembly protein OpcA
MSTLQATEVGAPSNGATTIPIDKVESELGRRLKATTADRHAPVHTARMSNLIVYCSQQKEAERVEALVPGIVAFHPARVLLVVAEAAAPQADVTASVLVRQVGSETRLVSEQVTLRAAGRGVEHLPFAVRQLLIGDLPTNLWWACSTPPPLAGTILRDLSEHAQQIVYDSLGWADPHKGIAATSDWLAKYERDAAQGRWRVASDINWRRLKLWRRLLSQGLAPSTAPEILPNVTSVLIEHGPHAVTQAWELASWLASRLGWGYQSSKVELGKEISFVFKTEKGAVKLRIDRLAEGPPEVRRVKVEAGPDGAIGVLDFAAEGDDRLSVTSSGAESTARTVAVQPVKVAELIGRQLSDREPDPIFREAMKVAHFLAQNVVS